MNALTLREQLLRIFCYIDGPQRAYFEIPTGIPEVPILTFPYETFAVAMRGEPEIAEPILCQWALAKLMQLTTEEQRQDLSVVLFWRSHPSVQEFTDEQGRACTKLRMRLCVPGYPLRELINAQSAEVRWL